MSLLIYSPRCKHSMDLVQYINDHSQLKQIVHYHNVNTQGIPNQYIDHAGFGGDICSMTPLEGSGRDSSMFYLDNYGQSLQPAMTKELEEKIGRDVSKGEAYTDLKM